MMLRIAAWLMLRRAPVEWLELLLPGSAASNKSDWSTLIGKTEVLPPLSKHFLWDLYHMDAINKSSGFRKRHMWRVRLGLTERTLSLLHEVCFSQDGQSLMQKAFCI